MSSHSEPGAAANQWEQAFAALAQKSPHFVTAHDRLHRLVFANDRAASMLGVKPHQAAGHGLGELRASSEAIELWRQTLTDVQRTGAVARVQLLLEDNHGQSGLWPGLCMPIGGAQPGGALTILRAPTVSDLDPPAGGRLLQLFLDALPTLAYIKDRVGRYVWTNRAMQEMFGLPPEDWPGKTVYDIQTGDEAESIARVDQEILASGTPRRADFSVARPDGSVMHRQSYRVPFTDSDGRLLLAGVSLDVTSWVEADRQRESLLKELEASNRTIREHAVLLESVLDSINEGVGVLDTEANVLLRNRKLCEIFGFQPAGSEPLSLQLTTVDGRPLSIEEKPYHRAMRGDEVRGEEYILIRPDGTKRQLLTTANAVRDGNGSIRYVITIFLDVTEFRQLERARSEFLRILSHDLRTPLAVVSAGAQLIQQFPANPEMVAGSAGRIASAAQRMSTMIQDLLESASLEAGRFDLRLQAIDLFQLVRQLIEDHGTALQVSRIVIDTPLAGKSLTVMADPDRVARVLLNLVTNALKYSQPPSPVVIRVACVDGEARVQVIDQGAGIAEEDQRRLFEPYYRVPGSPKGGLGLGLYIVKRLVEAHGGRVWIDSQPGRGTCAGFTLPLAE